MIDDLAQAGIAAAYPLSDLEPDPAQSIAHAAALLEVTGAGSRKNGCHDHSAAAYWRPSGELRREVTVADGVITGEASRDAS